MGKGGLALYVYAQIEPKYQKVDYSPKAKSSNIRDFLLPIGTVREY